MNLRDNLRLAQTLLRDEIVGRLFVQVLFNSLNLKELRRVLQLLVAVTMCRHEEKLLLVLFAQFLGVFAQNAVTRILQDPLAGVMNTTGVVLHFSPAVAHIADIIAQQLIRRIVALDRQRETGTHLHKQDAVGFVQEDAQLLRRFLQRRGYVRRAKELLGNGHHQFRHGQVGLRCHGLIYAVKDCLIDFILRLGRSTNAQREQGKQNG